MAMGFVYFILVLAYLSIMIYVGRRYFARRHGVGIVKGDTGVTTAGLIGLLWPVTLFMPDVRNPKMCSHHRHVLEHARLVEEFRAAEELKRGRGY
jgi:hypothetical protein